MNGWLFTAAVLAACIGIAHSWLGERYILIRLLRRADLPRLFGDDVFTKRTLRFAWHLTSVAWWGFAAILLLHVAPDDAPLEQRTADAIAVTFAASAAVAVVGSRGRHLSWVVFLMVAGAVWLGVR